MKFVPKYKTFHSSKCSWKCRLRNGGNLSRERLWVKAVLIEHADFLVFIFSLAHWSVDHDLGYRADYTSKRIFFTLPWRHNDHDSVSNHQPHGCLLKRLFGRKSKKTSKLRVTGLCAGNSPGPVNSPHKRLVTQKMFPFDDVIMRQTFVFKVLSIAYHPVGVLLMMHHSCFR